MEQFTQQCIGTKLVEIIRLGRIQGFLLGFKRSDGFFKQLVLATLIFREWVDQTWAKHDQFVHVLLISSCLWQYLIEQAN